MNQQGIENKIFVELILKKIPAKFSPVDYLMQTLDLKKGAAYRRIRNQVPFTFGEIIKLSSNLGFSLDEIIKQIKQDPVIINLKISEDIFT